MKKSHVILIGFIIIFTAMSLSWAVEAFEDEVKPDTRCTVCGMFVAKYPSWISKITDSKGSAHYFDGVKDMLVYYFHPESYGATKQTRIVKVEVKDYYSLAEIEAQKAFYVTGSDVYGPMGHELIPFSSMEAAQAFKADHHGKKILQFNEITPSLVEAMRTGHKMK